MSKKGLHVAPRGDRWSVHSAGALRSSGIYRTLEEAIEAAREYARDRGTELYIHGSDGRIRERRSFGSDPVPPKG